eukprot:890931-Amphidinium_carterae.2
MPRTLILSHPHCSPAHNQMARLSEAALSHDARSQKQKCQPCGTNPGQALSQETALSTSESLSMEQ